MKRFAFIAIALLSGVTSSHATTFLFTMTNKSASDISKFTVRKAQVEGSTKVPSGGKSEVKVTLPDGKCRSEIHIDFADPHYLDDDKVIDFCKYGGLTIN